MNIASVAGIRGGNPHLLYPTSKGAVVVSRSFVFVVCIDKLLTPFAEYDKSHGESPCT